MAKTFWILVLIGGLLMFTGCEGESSIMILSGSGSVGNSSVVNVTNNITNNITSNMINNYTTSLNTSFACASADEYVYNYSIINNVATGLCAVDSTGGDTTYIYNYTYNITYNITNNITENITNNITSNDGTGGWTNTTTTTRTGLNVTLGNEYTYGASPTALLTLDAPNLNQVALRIGRSNTSYLDIVSQHGFPSYLDILAKTTPSIYIYMESGGSGGQVAGDVGFQRSVFISNNLTINGMNNCDVKTNATGSLYCGTDATGASSGLTKTEYPITNKRTVTTVSTTGLLVNLNMTSGKIYNVLCDLITSSNVTTVGLRINTSCTGTPTAVNLSMVGYTSATATSIVARNGCGGAGVTTTGTGAASSTTIPVKVMVGIVANAATQFNLTFGEEVITSASVVSVMEGSLCTATQLN